MDGRSSKDEEGVTAAGVSFAGADWAIFRVVDVVIVDRVLRAALPSLMTIYLFSFLFKVFYSPFFPFWLCLFKKKDFSTALFTDVTPRHLAHFKNLLCPFCVFLNLGRASSKS